MSSFLSSLNLSPFALVAVGLIVLAVAIVLLVVWVIAIDRRTRGVVDGLEVERRKVAEMQVIVSQRVGRGPQRPQGRSGSGARGAGPRAAASVAAREQNPGASRVGVPQSAEMGSQRVRAAQPAAAAQARQAATGRQVAAQPSAPLSQEEQAFAAWVQERAQAMEQQGRPRGSRGRAAAQPAPAAGAQGGRSRSSRAGREAQDPHAISVPRGVDKTGGVPMDQWTGPVGRSRGGQRTQRGQVARQATAAAQAQPAYDPRDPRVAQSHERVEEAARAQRAAAQAQRRQGAQPAVDPQAQARRADPRAQARAAVQRAQASGQGASAAGSRAAASRAAVDARTQARAAQSSQAARAQRAAAQAQQAPRQDRGQARAAVDSRPWQNPRANANASARQVSPSRGSRGGSTGSGYVQVDAPAAHQPHSYAQGTPSSPLQPRDSRRPMTRSHDARPVSGEPIPVQVEAASSTGLFRRKKNAEPARGKHAR